MTDISKLIGKTITKIDGLSEGSEDVTFHTAEGTLTLYHNQDCCESVSVEEYHGDPGWLIGSPVLTAEERVSDNEHSTKAYDSATWTFYELATNKGSVTIRWLGTSNGYYSECVDVEWKELSPD